MGDAAIGGADVVYRAWVLVIAARTEPQELSLEHAVMGLVELDADAVVPGAGGVKVPLWALTIADVDALPILGLIDAVRLAGHDVLDDTKVGI